MKYFIIILGLAFISCEKEVHEPIPVVWEYNEIYTRSIFKADPSRDTLNAMSYLETSVEHGFVRLPTGDVYKVGKWFYLEDVSAIFDSIKL